LYKIIQLIVEFSAISILFLSLLIQVGFWLIIFRKLALCDTSTPNNLDLITSASVIICSKNNAANLKSYLKTFLSQEFPDLKVLLVDDYSDDETPELIKDYQQTERHLRYHKVTKNSPGKKQALKEGIVKSKTEWLLFSDADCAPKSDTWATKMIEAALFSGRSIVLGYSPYRTNGSFLQQWIHFEAWITGVQYLSYVLMGTPYMGVGRNLLFKREIIQPEVIAEHEDIISGDDDLTVNLIANKDNTTICIDSEAFVLSESLNTWNAYFSQKTRHFSTAHRYKLIHKLLLSLYSMSQVLFFITLFIVLLLGNYAFALCLYLKRKKW